MFCLKDLKNNLPGFLQMFPVNMDLNHHCVAFVGSFSDRDPVWHEVDFDFGSIGFCCSLDDGIDGVAVVEGRRHLAEESR